MTTHSRHWLTITEYFSLIASVGGTVAAIITQQMVWATSPLILTLGLNLINRERGLKVFQEFLDRQDVVEDLSTRRLNQLEMSFTNLQQNGIPQTTVNLGQLNERLTRVEYALQQAGKELGDNWQLSSDTQFNAHQVEGFNALLAELKDTIARLNQAENP